MLGLFVSNDFSDEWFAINADNLIACQNASTFSWTIFNYVLHVYRVLPNGEFDANA